MEATPSTQLPAEVQAALDDVRRIREMVDRSSANHPVRFVMRPLMIYLMIVGPLTAAYGVVSHLVSRSDVAEVAGVPRETFLWVFGAVCFVAFAALKSIVTAVASHREGWALRRTIARFYTAGYLRVALPGFALAAALGLFAARLGAGWAIVGIVTACIGAILVAAPLAVPLPEFTPMGVFLMAAGLAALFFLPAYPFLQIGVIWGGGMFGFGLFGLFRFRSVR